ncbi:MAG TPA: CbiX/SirB N-terminal domain-containing protein [Bryobacteraceae bacterium]|nr:CbiX/SirB N-terminal domain-containing protein [Bryobacteraceae bacterium]
MNTDKAIGIVVFGHGSSVASANAAVAAVADRAASAGGWSLYETAFLECPPRLEDAVRELVSRGAREVLVLPYFLTLGIHLQRDLPVLVDDLAAKYRVAIRVSPPLDGHAGLEKILVDRANEALS